MASRHATLAVVAAAQFLVVGATSIASIALPTMQHDLGATPTGAQWIVNAYVLTLGSLVVTGGALADRYGRRTTFLAGLGVFAAGSAVCGWAPSLGWLIAGRLLQGVGPALVQPAGIAILRERFDDLHARSRAIGLLSACSGVALAVGPAVGGVLVDALGWRSIFLLNLPVLLVIMAFGIRALPRSARRAGVRTRLDVRGVLLAATAMSGLCLGLIEGQDLGWTSPSILCAFLVGAGALLAFAAWEGRAEAPMLDVALFRVPAYVATNLVALIVFGAFIGVIVFISMFFQEVQGHSPTVAGLLVLPIGCATALAAPLATRLVNAFGSRLPIVAGLVLSAGGLLALLRLDAATGTGAIWWNLALLGFGVGLAVTPLNHVVVSMVDRERAGIASGVINTMRQFGQLLGVAVFGAIVFGASSTLADGFVGGLHVASLTAATALLALAAFVLATLPRFPERSFIDRPPRAKGAPSRRI